MAVKIIDIDNADYKLSREIKDQAIKDFVNETKILHTLKDSKAKNINTIHSAFAFYSQLWIVSDYCPGGSVSTLMKASPRPGLEERYIIAISRELAVALKHVHEVGIIHRDVKAANVLITQDGQLQLCDFGVSGILESNVAKRSTIIGTPNWMPPEMHDDSMPDSYGTEIDCWAYGCTVFELATGQPPNVGIDPGRLHLFLRKAPRLEGESHSTNLRDFVSYCLEEKPQDRPSANDILKHSFVSATSEGYPTAILRELIERYAHWEQLGGQRQSLFDPRGANVVTPLDPILDEDDEWNFSTTDEFDFEMLQQEGISVEEMDQLAAGDSVSLSPSITSMTAYERAQFEQRVARAEKQLKRIFELDGPTYEHSAYWDEEAGSDLPLRTTSDIDVRESVIDLDAAFGGPQSPNIELRNIPTIKAGGRRHQFIFDDENDDTGEEPSDASGADPGKRSTMAWKFPALTMPTPANRKTVEWTFPSAVNDTSQDHDVNDDFLENGIRSANPNFALNRQSRPPMRHMVTEPVGNFGDHLHGPAQSIHLDLDDATRLSMADPTMANRSTLLDMDDSQSPPAVNQEMTSAWAEHAALYTRPTTSYSSTAESSISESSTGNPFDIQDAAYTAQRGSLHAHSQSEPQSYRTSKNEFERECEHLLTQNVHTRGSSWSNDAEFNLSRAPSVKASMDSLRNTTDEDDEYSLEDHALRPHVASGLWNSREREAQNSAAPLSLDTSTMRRAFPMVNGIDKTLRPRGRRRGDRGRALQHAAPPEPPPNPMPDFARIQPYQTPEAPSAVAFQNQASQDEIVAQVRKVLMAASLSSGNIGEVSVG